MARQRFREPWASCSVCGFDVPISRIRKHRRWGWQCLDCFDSGPDRDELVGKVKIPPYEGVRRTAAPVTNTVNEGVDGDVEAGDS